MIPRITFPLLPGDVAAALAACRAQLKASESEAAILRTLIKQIQDYCCHEGQAFGTDTWGFPDATGCRICGSTRRPST